MSFTHDLAQIFSRPTQIVGIGNPLRSDDGVGCYIADTLAQQLPAGSPHAALNVEDVIENYVFALVAGPAEHILLVDAISGSGQTPGSLVLGKLRELETGGGYSTHKLALSMAAQLLEQQGKQVYLLGISAHNIDFGLQMEPAIQDSAAAVIDLLCQHAGRSH
ncbi:hydrogenase maturation protease [Chitinibacter sp. ZOR0017]|uniref:hydrogenase maturation protease n=1 Tax=Chitinibacter sp. ZOR0017 TaxID=1339254 RepID=UPI000648D8D2|nr:hydrogenase maturation protease [Chitinibacter sp. ZOR0017]